MPGLKKAKGSLENMKKPLQSQSEAMCDIPYV